MAQKIELKFSPKGEVFAILGPNGAGKTTLIKIMCSLITPTSGTALINGYDVVKDEDRIKSLVGLVIGEERSFYWRLSGRENLEFFGVLHNLSLREGGIPKEYHRGPLITSEFRSLRSLVDLIVLEKSRDLCIHEIPPLACLVSRSLRSLETFCMSLRDILVPINNN